MKKILTALGALLLSSWVFAAVNINTAGVAELQTLPHIGPAKAQAIVEYRQKNGNFKSAEDITKVSGIGKVTYERLKGDITVQSAAPAAKKADKPASR